ncbi:hypothetical protein AN480_03685 [Mycobacterium intracellulare subsp. chimaera]|uniref:hypothetical protein n=1 Tax=Mycobacterium intracellulare TaxID=1767 RepID=UPI0008592E91|nr:hypothetical protein [Mycobacterium intracellulare]AOS90768.1 hypothetical protein AN480_03685 [Mycobacterium intracellulare subsp. chimaera]
MSDLVRRASLMREEAVLAIDAAMFGRWRWRWVVNHAEEFTCNATPRARPRQLKQCSGRVIGFWKAETVG